MFIDLNRSYLLESDGFPYEKYRSAKKLAKLPQVMKLILSHPTQDTSANQLNRLGGQIRDVLSRGVDEVATSPHERVKLTPRGELPTVCELDATQLREHERKFSCEKSRSYGDTKEEEKREKREEEAQDLLAANDYELATR